MSTRRVVALWRGAQTDCELDEHETRGGPLQKCTDGLRARQGRARHRRELSLSLFDLAFIRDARWKDPTIR